MTPQPIVYVTNQPAISALVSHYAAEVSRAPNKLLSGPGFVPGTALPDVDWASLVGRFLASATTLVDTFTGTDDQKRDAVIAAATQFYATVLEPFVQTAVGHPIVYRTVVGPLIAAMIPKIAGSAYDAVAGLLARTGNPAAAPTVAVPGLPAGFVPY